MFEPYDWRKDTTDLRVVQDRTHYYHTASKRPPVVSGYDFALAELGRPGLVLDGKTYVLVPDSPSLNEVQSGMTIEAWLFGAPASNRGTLVSKYVWPLRGGYRVSLAHGLVYYTLSGDGGTRTLTSGLKGLRLGEWNQIVCTWDGTAMRIYWNGREDKGAYTGGQGKSAAYSGPSLSTRPLTIGCALDREGKPERFLTGLLRDVRLYGRALSPDEVRRRHETAGADDTRALRAHWRLDRAEARLVGDLSGNGNGGTITGLADDESPEFCRRIDCGTAPGRIHRYEPGTIQWDKNRSVRLHLLLGADPTFAEIPTAYNRLVIALDSHEERVCALERAIVYARPSGVPLDTAESICTGAIARLADFQKGLEEVYDQYAEIYLEHIGNALPMSYRANRITVLQNEHAVALAKQAIASAKEAFDRAGFPQRIAAINRKIITAEAKIDAALDSMRNALEGKYQWRKSVPALKPAPRNVRAIEADGTCKRFLFDIAMYGQIPELAGILGVYDATCVGWFTYETGKPGEYDFSPHGKYLTEKATVSKQSWFLVPSGLHGRFYMPDWFVKKYRGREDIFRVSQDGLVADRRPWMKAGYLNYWNPTCRRMFLKFLDGFARHNRSDDRFLFYLLAWEDYWDIKAGGKSRTPGYSPSARSAFRQYLRGKYGDLAELNRQWRTDYASFGAIEPPDDQLIAPRTRATPLSYEFDSFRLDTYTDFLAEVYRTCKRADPTKPVVHDDASYMKQMIGSKKFEKRCADVYSRHSGDTDMLLVYMQSMKRHFGCSLGNVESDWNCYSYDPSDERITQAAAKKYVTEMVFRDQVLHPWWYAVSSGVAYSMNQVWFDPRYDFTILRYSCSAIPVITQAIRQIEPVVLNTRSLTPRIALVEPTTTAMNIVATPHPVTTEMLTCHRQLFAREKSYDYDFVPEALIVRDRRKLDPYDVLVLPYVLYFPDGLAEMLKSWVRSGGVLISLGPFGQYDKFGFEDGVAFEKMVGELASEGQGDVRSCWLKGKRRGTQLVRKAFGKGEVLFMNRSLARTLSERKGEVEGFLAEHTKRRAYSQTNRFALTLREDAEGVRYLCAFSPDLEKAHEDTIVVEGEYPRPIDVWLDGCFPIPGASVDNGSTRFKLKMQPAGRTVIKLN